jgi:hypothetical protein
MKNFLDEVVEKIKKTYLIFNNVYKKMWKNMVEPDSLQITI